MIAQVLLHHIGGGSPPADPVVDILVLLHGHAREDGIVTLYVSGIDTAGNGRYRNDCDNDMFGKLIHVCHLVLHLMG